MFLAAVAPLQEARTCSPLPRDRCASCSEANTEVAKNSELGGGRIGAGVQVAGRRWAGTQLHRNYAP
jgi:hypothetical protein